MKEEPDESQIEYRVPCGLLPAAEEAEHRILGEVGEGIEGLEMKPGHGGVFAVRVDDEVVFDKSEDPTTSTTSAGVTERLRAPRAS